MYSIYPNKKTTLLQQIRLEFKFSAVFAVLDFVAYSIVLTPKLISISSDGQRHFDLL